ncbi:hypothetical protein CHLRE_10g445000v5 [Chlamydomonas reinhardtii]|uniref:Sodium/sulfate cotransporter 2 n=2 Tax=Chlamydomonas reinhardtii TaxID=3055 RepID=SLT2_CHLRE|nr:uncharacterized protein CHLRE_10g445000v5 [Chlamydomonas reinhardtii]XP_042920253.1 uncharacterized protein CHLRE_10g445000v5 [Chlamydomonas reinhardtii]D2K6F1.1 RecName: Full=Sodium/sulfate cotransporter 2; AltName: Full=SAC1-like transporter 2; Short=CrSLT2 [Chlamydomonas reinhardtii]ACZ63169.1 sodium/sulfate transporter [Chlamydomonas reinhardtii]PNW77626.1 hypothetical protein CHLRE_10g445000v5 [Chlamydomonas reinhardtii]PNW77627.1 hypothetical protein CHLRE_10g445000v5 [Chlamydomonas r
MGFGWQGSVSIAFTALAFVVMAADWVGPDVTFTVLLAFLTAFDGQIVTVAKAAAGYGNTGLLTVIFLYWVAEGITQTGGLELIMNFVLGRSRSVHWALARSMFPVMCLSAFLNNTPCVTFMIPILISWGRRCGVPIKKLLIPLSYASVLGGTCTSIGTSTNLVIVGLQDARYTKAKQLDQAKFQIFDIAPYGVPYALWGFVFILLTQAFLLPGNSSRYAKDLLIAVRVLPSSSVAKKKLKDSGLLQQSGFSVSGIYRDGKYLSKPDPNWVLEPNDILYAAGEFDVVEFVGEEFGLGLVNADAETSAERPFTTGEESVFTPTGGAPYQKLVQATIAPTSDLIGRTVREVSWQGRFGLIPVAIQRGNGREDGRLNDVVLAAGDVLILDTTPFYDEEREDSKNNFAGKVRAVKDGAAKEFVVGVKVKKSSEVVNKTVSAAGLRGIPGLFVLSVDRADGSSVEASDYLYKIQPDDTIWIATDIGAVGFLAKFPGLELVQQEQVDKTGTSILYRHLVQAAVSHKGPIVGKTVRDVRFRTLYNAAVVAVHREGARVPLKVQDIVLQGGDVLLISCHTNWADEHRHDKSFVLLQPVPDSSPPKRSRMVIGVLLATGMVLTQIVGGLKSREYIHLWPAAVLTSALMLLTGCMNADQARKAIYWDVYLTIAAAFGVSAALEGTGVAASFANGIISIGKNLHSDGAALIAIYIATAMLSELLTNNAAGAIMYPIAAIAGDALKISPKETSVAIMLGASAGFINPFSYQCNLMVYAAGNYSVREFAIIGAPFQIWLMIVAGFILCYMKEWHQVWIVSWICTAGIVLLPALYFLLPTKVQLRIDAFFDRVAQTLNPKLIIERRNSIRRQASRTGSDGTGSSDSPRALGVPKVITA